MASRFLRNFDAKREYCWIAERHGENVGSVIVVPESDEIAVLRLLIVDPSAHGLGINKRLVEESIRFARTRGYRVMTLWTNDILVAARYIYEDAGLKLVKEAHHRSFGRDLVGQNLNLDL